MTRWRMSNDLSNRSARFLLTTPVSVTRRVRRAARFIIARPGGMPIVAQRFIASSPGNPPCPSVPASLLHTSRNRLARPCPGGAFESSPAVHCWVNGRSHPVRPSVPAGTIESFERSGVPPGTAPQPPGARLPSNKLLGYFQASLWDSHTTAFESAYSSNRFALSPRRGRVLQPRASPWGTVTGVDCFRPHGPTAPPASATNRWPVGPTRDLSPPAENPGRCPGLRERLGLGPVRDTPANFLRLKSSHRIRYNGSRGNPPHTQTTADCTARRETGPLPREGHREHSPGLLRISYPGSRTPRIPKTPTAFRSRNRPHKPGMAAPATSHIIDGEAVDER